MTAKKAKSEVLNVAVQYGKVSIGEDTASISVAIDREAMNIVAADECLCGNRLIGRLLVMPKDEHPDQKQAFDKGNRFELAGVFDVKSFGVTRKRVSATLSFSLADIPTDKDLRKLAKKSGRLVVDLVGDLPDGEGEKEEEDKEKF